MSAIPRYDVDVYPARITLPGVIATLPGEQEQHLHQLHAGHPHGDLDPHLDAAAAHTMPVVMENGARGPHSWAQYGYMVSPGPGELDHAAAQDAWGVGPPGPGADPGGAYSATPPAAPAPPGAAARVLRPGKRCGPDSFRRDGPLPPLFGEPMPLAATDVDGDPVDLSAPARLHGLARLDPEHDPESLGVQKF
ncbi:Protein SFI1-like protein [Frankliniella fusca]|uniref:Protein SFI1-like protein n=1 Tax=Frankliniella fusca TaxID=407009 RepID=A0AAE1H6G6_9NEOP|nr:Protein SFI1-like protein [Frankliniella fusca]